MAALRSGDALLSFKPADGRGASEGRSRSVPSLQQKETQALAGGARAAPDRKPALQPVPAFTFHGHFRVIHGRRMGAVRPRFTFLPNSWQRVRELFI